MDAANEFCPPVHVNTARGDVCECISEAWCQGVFGDEVCRKYGAHHGRRARAEMNGMFSGCFLHETGGSGTTNRLINLQGA